MAPNSLSPASVVIAYHTLYGSHKMTIPTREWSPVPVAGDLGSFISWAGSPIDGEGMVSDLVGFLAALVLTTTVFDSVTVYTQDTPTSDNIPKKSVALGVSGTGTTTSKSQAQSATFNFKTSANGDMKIVLLDSPYWSGGFLAQHPTDFSTPDNDFIGYFTDTGHAFSGRDDTRPTECRKITFDLNDKLQKAYRMSA